MAIPLVQQDGGFVNVGSEWGRQFPRLMLLSFR